MGNDKKINNIEQLKDKVEFLKEGTREKTVVSLCSGTGCKAAGSDDVFGILKKEVKKYSSKSGEKIIMRRTGCHGFCERGPLIIFYPHGICYLGATEEDIPEIIKETLDGNIVERLLYKTDDEELIKKEFEIPFYKHQKRILLRNNSRIDSKSIDDYILYGGYRGLAKALKDMTPEEVLKDVKNSGLRGRGGGGFPTGFKWEITRKAQGSPKYMIVNADEGDPGAYMDRSILEGSPHSVLEGLIIAAYAIGANKGYIYVRQEYPLAVENVKTAIVSVKSYGFLGEDILGSGFDFEIIVYQGAGAFVCEQAEENCSGYAEPTGHVATHVI